MGRPQAAALANDVDLLADYQDRLAAQDTFCLLLAPPTGAALSPACVAAGELIAAERQERVRLRSSWPKVWKRAKARQLRRWLCGTLAIIPVKHMPEALVP